MSYHPNNIENHFPKTDLNAIQSFRLKSLDKLSPDEDQPDAKGLGFAIFVSPVRTGWILRALIIATIVSTVLLQMNFYDIQFLIAVGMFSLGGLIVLDLLVSTIFSLSTLRLIVGLLQTVVFFSLLLIAAISVNALFFRLRGMPIGDDLQMILDLIPVADMIGTAWLAETSKAVFAGLLANIMLKSVDKRTTKQQEKEPLEAQ